jgi:hypothetical protein
LINIAFLPRAVIPAIATFIKTLNTKDIIPLDNISSYSEDIIESVKSLAIREMVRMKDFASISENPSVVDKLVTDIVTAYNIDFEEERRDQYV